MRYNDIITEVEEEWLFNWYRNRGFPDTAKNVREIVLYNFYEHNVTPNRLIALLKNYDRTGKSELI